MSCEFATSASNIWHLPVWSLNFLILLLLQLSCHSHIWQSQLAWTYPTIGEATKTQEMSNFPNTTTRVIGGLKHLIGRSASDPELVEIEKIIFHNATWLVDVNGWTVGAEVLSFYLIVTCLLSVYLLPWAVLGLNISWMKAKVFCHAVGSLDPRMYFAKLRNIIMKSPLMSSRLLLSPISPLPSQAAASGNWGRNDIPW